MTAAQTSGWVQGAAERAVPNAFLARSQSGSVTAMVGAGNDRPGMAHPGKPDPGMPGRGMEAPEMGAGSRAAARQAAPGMGFAQAVGANAVPLSVGVAMANAPMEIAPTEIVHPAIGLPVIGPMALAAARIAPRQAIVPDLNVVRPKLARPSAVPLTGDPRNGELLIGVLVADSLAVPLVAWAPGVLALAGPIAPVLVATGIGQGPVRRSLRWLPKLPQARQNAIAMNRRPI